MVVADRLEQVRILCESAEGDRGVLLWTVLTIMSDGKEWRHDREHREHRETLVILGALCEAQGGVPLHPGIRALQQLDQGWQPAVIAQRESAALVRSTRGQDTQRRAHLACGRPSEVNRGHQRGVRMALYLHHHESVQALLGQELADLVELGAETEARTERLKE